MSSDLLIYGSYGFVGEAIVRQALKKGIQPILAGRNAEKVRQQAGELGLESRVFDLEDRAALRTALSEVKVVLHCAGPYIHTYHPMLEACLATGAHYLDITGEIPVYQAIASRHEEAKRKGVMLLPGVGFDVMPTDCLALHLKQRLPSATHLTLAFQMDGPAGIPPGTARTMLEMIPYGIRFRHKGKIIQAASGEKSRQFPFRNGPVKAVRSTWGDIFTAFYSTGIPNIENYIALKPEQAQMLKYVGRLRPLFKNSIVRTAAKNVLPSGSTADERALTITNVWGEVKDGDGNRVASRLHGPEAGVEWTADCAVLAVQKVLEGLVFPGYQTPGLAFGADLVLECHNVQREDVI